MPACCGGALEAGKEGEAKKNVIATILAMAGAAQQLTQDPQSGCPAAP
jgi:hypothetical protein